MVKIRSATLLLHGWKKAIEIALHNLTLIGFTRVEVSMNRADYCMDFLNARVEIDPKDFVAHARVTKSVHNSVSETNIDGVRSIVRADHVESVTLGKMPNRQIIVYDKRKEVINKKKHYWFKAWGIDKNDATQTVLRVELRAGKTELKKYNIKTLEELYERIGDVFKAAVDAIRHVQPRGTNTNASRLKLSPLWRAVTVHVQTCLFEHISGIDQSSIKLVFRENQARLHEQQIMGNIAAWSLCLDVPYEDIPIVMGKLVRDKLTQATCNEGSKFAKSHVRARDRLKFII